MYEIIFVLLFITVLVLFIVTLFLVDKKKNTLKDYGSCTGLIIGFDKNTTETRLGDYESEAISPIIFYTVDGQKRQLVGNYYSTNMKRGQIVELLYDKNDPSKVVIKKGLWLGPVITGSLAAFFCLSLIVCSILNYLGVFA